MIKIAGKHYVGVTHDDQNDGMYIVLSDCMKWYGVEFRGTFEECMNYIKGVVKA